SRGSSARMIGETRWSSAPAERLFVVRSSLRGLVRLLPSPTHTTTVSQGREGFVLVKARPVSYDESCNKGHNDNGEAKRVTLGYSLGGSSGSTSSNGHMPQGTLTGEDVSLMNASALIR